MAGHPHIDRVRILGHRGGTQSRASSPPYQEQSVELDRTSFLVALLDASLGRCSRHIPLGVGPGDGPGHAEGTMSLGCPGPPWASPEELVESVSLC